MENKLRDTNDMRICTVTKNAADTDVTNSIKIIIQLQQALPIISLSQSVGNGPKAEDKSDVNLINYNTALTSVVNTPYSTTDVYNHLQDYTVPVTPVNGEPILPDDVFITDRFIHVAKVTSIVRKMDLEIYYDKKFKDMFMIPTLQHIGIDDNSRSQLNGTTLYVEGYNIGVRGNIRETNPNLIRGKESTVTFEEPLLNNITTKTHLLSFLGKTNKPSNNYGMMFNNGEEYLESVGGVPSEFVSLGGSEALFGSTVVTQKALALNVGMTTLKPIGSNKLADILIPIP